MSAWLRLARRSGRALVARPIVAAIGIGAAVLLRACVGGPAPSAAPTAPRTSGLAVDWSEAECVRAAVDPDRDGLDARCELALAAGFAPVLVVRAGGCGWDHDASPGRPGGGYAFAVQHGRDSGFVRIAYLPAYYRDCGWTGAKCWLPLVDCTPHAGDSEAIIVEVEYDDATDRWRTRGVFLSSHCFGRGAGACRWYGSEALDAFAWADERPRGAPVVWVAAGRQANYPSAAACDRGHFFLDSCDRNDARLRFPVVSRAQNVGSRTRPVGGDGCVTVEALTGDGRLAAPAVIECFWSPHRPFRGWQHAERSRRASGATAYHRYLVEVAGF